MNWESEHPEFYSLTDAKLSQLGPWFEDIHQLRGSVGGLRHLLTSRWRTFSGEGIKQLVGRVLQGIPCSIRVDNGFARLVIECKHSIRDSRGRFQDRSSHWLVAPPDPEDVILDALRSRHLHKIPGLFDFYSCFNQSITSSGYWPDVRQLSPLWEYYSEEYPAGVLPRFSADVYRSVLQAARRCEDFIPTAEGDIHLRKWYVLNWANCDAIILDQTGSVAVLINMADAYVFRWTFREFLRIYAEFAPREGCEFMDDYFGGSQPITMDA